jgi:hypothetical protein
MARFIKRNLKIVNIKIDYISDEKINNSLINKHNMVPVYVKDELTGYYLIVDEGELNESQKMYYDLMKTRESCDHFGSILLGFLELNDLKEPLLFEVLFCKKCKDIIFFYNGAFYNKKAIISLYDTLNDNIEEIMNEIFKEEE